ncbi:pyocin knob domain-containing protein [Latilactobacillus sp. 5-91]|uniref:pyocin knob domain-containing protein n=1 Tax=Latilactobacillus sp. 5-91 TaxID=3410924 RepID=UPI003C72BD5A
MTEKFNGAISATGINLISQAIENNTKLQFLSAIGSATSYTNEQLVKLTDSDLKKLSKNQTGHISNITIKNHDTVYFEITLDGNTVSADYGLNSVVILTKIGTTDHLFAVLKANQVQYMNAYDGKSSTNLQINVGFKISNTDVVSLEIDSAGTLTAADYKKLQEYTDVKSGDAERNADVYAKGLVDKEAEVRAAADSTESKARIDADSKQNASLASETKQRTDADNAINKKIASVENTANTAVHHDKPEQMNAGFKFTDNVIINGASELKMNTGSGSGDNPVLKSYNTEVNYGDMIALGAGGNTIVGSGESAKGLAQAIMDGKVTSNIPPVTKDNEVAYFVSDGEGYLITGYQSPANAKVIPVSKIIQLADTVNWQKQPIFKPGTHRYAVCPSGKDFGEFLKSSAVPIGFSIIRDENTPITNFNVVKESASWIYAIASQGTGVLTYVVANGVGQGKKFFRNNNENDDRYMTRNNVIPKNADLNSYKNAGFYFNAHTDEAKTMKNLPVGEQLAFSLEVTENAGCTQKFYTYEANNIGFRGVYVRNFYANSWSPWKVIPLSDADVPSVTAGVNFNSYVKSGTYLVSGVSDTINAPTTGGLYGFLRVSASTNGGGGFKTQFYQSSVGASDIYIRNFSGANPVWTPWRRIVNSIDLDNITRNLNSHTGNKTNPHGVTAGQVGAYTTKDIDSKVAQLRSETAAHTGSKSNPHSVTAGQTGAYTKSETDTKINSHVGNKSNPHAVTSAQVGSYSKGEVDGKVNALNTNIQKVQTNLDNNVTKPYTKSSTGVKAMNGAKVTLNYSVQKIGPHTELVMLSGNCYTPVFSFTKPSFTIPNSVAPTSDWTFTNPATGVNSARWALDINGNGICVGVTGQPNKDFWYSLDTMYFRNI